MGVWVCGCVGVCIPLERAATARPKTPSGAPRAVFSQRFRISYEMTFSLKLSSDEVYYTARSLLVILKKSCSKHHCQKVLN